MTTYYTADLHFGHRNIITYCNRPWRTLDGHPDAEAMTEALIARINERVRADDELIVAGDVALHWKAARIRELMDRIVCRRRILVRGNHDTGYMEKAGFEAVSDELIRDDVFIIHKPPTDLEWFGIKQANPQVRYCFCGHEHEKFVRRGDIINVGVDVRDWYPRTKEELLG